MNEAFDRMYQRIAELEPLVDQPKAIRAGQLWISRKTSKRAIVRWWQPSVANAPAIVGYAFRETGKTMTLTEQAFRSNYQPA